MSRRASFAAALLLLAPALALSPLGSPIAMHAQNNFGQRVVTGVVQGDNGAVSGATVFLRNEKNKSIRSYTTTADGRFRFVQVDMSQDFDLWAEKDGRKSTPKTISTWDTRKEVDLEVKLK
jgi:hypothetical protein